MALLRCLSFFFSFHAPSPHTLVHPNLQPILIVYEVIYVFFILLDKPHPFVILGALNVLNLRQVLVVV